MVKLFLSLFFCLVAIAQADDNYRQLAEPNHMLCSGSLEKCVAAAGVGTTITISEVLPPLTANVVVVPGVELSFKGLGLIACGSSTLTIKSSTANWPNRQIFASDCSSTGSVSFSGNQVSGPVRPEWWGAKADNSRDNQLEFTATRIAASTAGLGIALASGTYKFSSSLVWLTSGLVVQGAGNTVTTLSYTGSSAALVTAVSGTRVFRPSFRDFALTTSTGVIGLNLDSVSEGYFENLIVSGFSVACVDINGATPGYAVYNRFINIKAQSCGIGHRVQGTSHNANVWIGSRANVCVKGWEITDSNDNTIESSQSESNSDVGIYISATGAGLAYKNRIVNSRVENNTNYGIEIASTHVTETSIVSLWTSGNGADLSDLGTRTNRADDLLYVTSAGNMGMESGSFVAGSSFFTQGAGGYIGATNSTVLVKGQDQNDANAIGARISNSVTLNTTGAKVVEFCTDTLCTIPVASIRYNGSTWGLRLQSPDGTWYLLTIANGGTVSIAANP